MAQIAHRTLGPREILQLAPERSARTAEDESLSADRPECLKMAEKTTIFHHLHLRFKFFVNVVKYSPVRLYCNP